MEKFIVTIGTHSINDDGTIFDDTYQVEFSGERLAEVTKADGVTETLYKIEDQLVVHYQADGYGALRDVTETDLAPSGRYAELGKKLKEIVQTKRPPAKAGGFKKSH